MIPEFKINRSKPQSRLNRAFLWQIMMHSDNNLSFIRRLIKKEYKDMVGKFITVDRYCAIDAKSSMIKYPDISLLSEKDILNILKSANEYFGFNLLSEYYYWFGDKNLAHFDDFKNSPELYTGIDKVSFDKGGLILLYQCKHRNGLFTSLGEPVTDFFDTNLGQYICLGIKGMVEQTFSSVGYYDDYEVRHYVFQNKQLKRIDSNSEDGLRFTMDYFADRYFFPPGERDVIDEMLPEGEKLSTELDLSGPVNPEQLDQELKRKPHAEIFFRDQYYNNKELAAIVLKHKPIAYSCLSRKLQNDRSFILDLIKNKNLHFLYPYLRPNIKADKEILEQCIYAHPEFLMELTPLESKKLIKDFILNYYHKNDPFGNKAERTAPLSYASERIRSDRHFVLNLSEKYPDCLDLASENLQRDKKFVLDALRYKPLFIQDIHKTLQEDPDIIRESVKHGWHPYRDSLEGLPF